MSERIIFEYAVIRFVPRVEREEFLNVGVVLFCAKQKFLSALVKVDEARISSFNQDSDIEELKRHLQSFNSICAGAKSGGPIASLDQASRFRWLTAARSTIIQTSKVHPGLTLDAQETLNQLFKEQVAT
ncbi:DUF3037 domain-containing protein [Pedobacter flavus]|uniref:DUF3037 domain-containing protein n=1 Tax=Pedobacter flavus TaxID=3113906 RepID=A0ABU7H323_9SPHI|nr:DUF3037 domain-containing protein [Pedobacter sp. VNH31]MEE1885520.1 DUF3037 domain-containing protein [Pedobacter sp. VNH31]